MIVDLHSHISTKPMFIKHNKNCEEAYNFLAAFPIDDILADDAIDSQSSLSQIRSGGGNIIINPIYSLERCLARVGVIYNFLAGLTISDEDVLKGIANGTIRNYTHTGKEFNLVKQTPNIKMLTKQDPTFDPNTVNVLHAIEGLQGVTNTELEFTGKYSSSAFLHRLQKVIDQIEPVYVTLSHMTYNGLFNYAFGMKMSNKKNRAWFLPCDCGFDGITGLRKDILDMLQNEKILFDLKHLSLGNRIAVYKYAHEHQIPVILSHSAVTGLTVSDFFSFYATGAFKNSKIKNGKPFGDLLPDKYICKTIIPRTKGVYNRWFNSTQLNLMDEEIVMIMKLGGLIGLILDKRVLGNVKLKDLANNKFMDYLSPEDVPYIYEHFNSLIDSMGMDHKYHLPKSAAEISKVASNWIKRDNDIDKKDEKSQGSKKADLQRFCQQILHIIKVGKENGIQNPEKHIALGSDYDGLIASIKCAKTAADLSSFKEIVRNELKKNKQKPGSILKKHNIGVDRVVDGIFGFHALKFLQDRGRVVSPFV